MNVRDPDRELDRDIEGCARAHQQLLAGLDDLLDDDVGRASLLPGWTVGHVLSHLARNADSHVRMLLHADRGEVADQYVGGAAGRESEIEASASRSARELVRDVRSTIYALEAQWAAMSATGWDGLGRSAIGEVTMRELPFRRWREVEVHRVDLGLGATSAEWSPAYVRLDLERLTMTWAARRPMGLTILPQAALALAPHDRLAWLLGRLQVEGLAPAAIF